tara:strand:- start:357 stop:728 length:372 start_codon:yes stop_codon:yes gene_type:complete
LAIDLSTSEGRSSYLNDKLSDLINGVDSTYGNIIFDELLKRIDSTIKDFNAEMESVFDELKMNEKKRQSLLIKLKKKYTPEETEKKEKIKKEWEQKLLDLYSRDKDSTEESKETETTNTEDKK